MQFTPIYHPITIKIFPPLTHIEGSIASYKIFWNWYCHKGISWYFQSLWQCLPLAYITAAAQFVQIV